jgi:hypothetical protein
MARVIVPARHGAAISHFRATSLRLPTTFNASSAEDSGRLRYLRFAGHRHRSGRVRKGQRSLARGGQRPMTPLLQGAQTSVRASSIEHGHRYRSHEPGPPAGGRMVGMASASCVDHAHGPSPADRSRDPPPVAGKPEIGALESPLREQPSTSLGDGGDSVARRADRVDRHVGAPIPHVEDAAR